MRLNLTFVIVGFICTICAIPLPSPAESNAAQEVPAATAQHLTITIQFNDGVPKQTPKEEQPEGEAPKMVQSLMLSGLHSASEDGKLPGIKPYSEIRPPCNLAFEWQNSPRITSLSGTIEFAWTVTLKLPDSMEYSDNGLGWIYGTGHVGDRGGLRSDKHKGHIFRLTNSGLLSSLWEMNGQHHISPGSLPRVGK
ncbi:hypothetical protein BDP27DRAFT_1418181 [Rhodocollybia butyracea]|uniref:Uncharacterized protein n=1 Tax=Rhodocollybia butyracea TaxID=206335 RepID=A0A9P5PZI6_9AGAR|nr:hypothetical protein BDP27DRAFT_1418181 [Rhodocollybia butyracea]